MSSEHGNTRVIQFPASKHQTQRRKDADPSPCINHAIGVAQLLAEVGGISDINMLVAAVLHDTIEDAQTTARALEPQFGEIVRKAV